MGEKVTGCVSEVADEVRERCSTIVISVRYLFRPSSLYLQPLKYPLHLQHLGNFVEYGRLIRL